MKKSVVCFGMVVLLFAMLTTLQAELKVGYVNSDRILSEWAPAREAQQKLDVEAKNLENQYRRMVNQLDSLNQAYERQKLIMSESRREMKENEIAQLRQRVQQFQVEKMGPQGEIYQKQDEIVGPILEKIKQVIRKVGDDNNYDYILDTVSGNVLYADPAHDVTDQVLYELKRE